MCDRLLEWTKTWGMEFNVKKCNVLYVTLKTKKKNAVQVQNEGAENTWHPRYKISRHDIYRKTRLEHSHLIHQWHSQSNARLPMAKPKKLPKVNQIKGLQSSSQA